MLMKPNNLNIRPSRKINKISDTLIAFPDSLSEGDPTIGEIRNNLCGRNYGLLLLLLALLSMIPLPGLSMILAIPLILLTLQIMLGIKSFIFPQFITSRSIKGDHIRGICNRIAPYIAKIEPVISPRLKMLTGNIAERFVAFICLIMSLILFLPIPFGNTLPSFSICLFAIGIVQRDGLFIIAGVICSVLSFLLISTFVTGLYVSVIELL